MLLCSRQTRTVRAVVGLAVLGFLWTASAGAQSLKPSRQSLNRQRAVAQAHDFTYLRNRGHVQRFVQRGWLVRVPQGVDYRLHGVSFPFARPEVRLFIQRLSRQYRSACGERLVVTSLTRPKTHQPRNASLYSVHPTGMALDLRRSRNRRCRAWLEKTLLYLEGRRVLEASRERWPSHYHIALFPRPYRDYVSLITSARNVPYRVVKGDSLWSIARRYKTSVDRIRVHNDLSSNVIRPGQRLLIP